MVSSLSIHKSTCFYLILVLSLECNKICKSNALTKSTEHLDFGWVSPSLTIGKSTYMYVVIWTSYGLEQATISQVAKTYSFVDVIVSTGNEHISRTVALRSLRRRNIFPQQGTRSTSHASTQVMICLRPQQTCGWYTTLPRDIILSHSSRILSTTS